MTLPEQSDRAVAATREFLVRLSSPFVEDGIKGIRREIRAEALALLRHYPSVWTEERLEDTPAANATPSEGREQNRCTLTDEERAAIEVACQDLRHTEEVATLRGLLERLSP